MNPSNKQRQRRLTPAISLTIPEQQQEALAEFVSLIDVENYKDRVPSRSTVLTALIEIVHSKRSRLKTENVVDYDSLKAEIERILHEQ